MLIGHIFGAVIQPTAVLNHHQCLAYSRHQENCDMLLLLLLLLSRFSHVQLCATP